MWLIKLFMLVAKGQLLSNVRSSYSRFHIQDGFVTFLDLEMLADRRPLRLQLSHRLFLTSSPCHVLHVVYKAEIEF